MPENLNTSTGSITFHETNKPDIARVCSELFQQDADRSRVMAPTKAIVAEINRLVQDDVNPDGDRLEFELHGDTFYRNLRLGDSILFTQNNYDKGIQNGSLGTLTSVTPMGQVTLENRRLHRDHAVRSRLHGVRFCDHFT